MIGTTSIFEPGGDPFNPIGYTVGTRKIENNNDGNSSIHPGGITET